MMNASPKAPSAEAHAAEAHAAEAHAAKRHRPNPSGDEASSARHEEAVHTEADPPAAAGQEPMGTAADDGQRVTYQELSASHAQQQLELHEQHSARQRALWSKQQAEQAELYEASQLQRTQLQELVAQLQEQVAQLQEQGKDASEHNAEDEDEDEEDDDDGQRVTYQDLSLSHTHLEQKCASQQASLSKLKADLDATTRLYQELQGKLAQTGAAVTKLQQKVRGVTAVNTHAKGTHDMLSGVFQMMLEKFDAATLLTAGVTLFFNMAGGAVLGTQLSQLLEITSVSESAAGMRPSAVGTVGVNSTFSGAAKAVESSLAPLPAESDVTKSDEVRLILLQLAARNDVDDVASTSAWARAMLNAGARSKLPWAQ